MDADMERQDLSYEPVVAGFAIGISILLMLVVAAILL
jgi:hypothetical protein